MRIERLVAYGCLLLAAKAGAQQWCPPGAEWRYPYVTSQPLYQPNGTLRYLHAGDSLFQGQICQHFVSHVFLLDTMGALHQSDPVHHFTTTSSGAIRYWNTLIPQPQFDTLAYFDAAPGSGWTYNLSMAPKTITVQDTGTNTVGGIPLRYVVIASDPPWMHTPLPTDTIYERIGALGLHTFNPAQAYMVLDLAANSLGCYRDDEMEYVSPWYEFSCNSTVTVEERSPDPDVMLCVYPNPGRDQFRFMMPQGSALMQASVFDARGVLVLETQHITLGAWLNVERLASGLYTIVLTTAEGERRYVKWIKE